ncbi:hypothetical protein [Streptomyces brasiliscabiei]|uniref:hypothetical protein n=1 Tax=Streptomyces brasiliscabiei TaxID=2736302 RepID=UPI0038F782AE
MDAIDEKITVELTRNARLSHSEPASRVLLSRRDLLERAVQARGAGGQQADDLAHPPAHGGAVDAVAAGQVAWPLVTAQHRQHDPGDLPGGQRPPRRADRIAVAADQIGGIVQGGARQWQAGGVDKAVRALDGFVVFLHTKLNCRREPAGYAHSLFESGNYGRTVNLPSPRLCSQPRSASLVNFPRSGSSLPRTPVSRPNASPTARVATGPPHDNQDALAVRRQRGLGHS